MKRSAEAAWRCERAISPGRMSCSPAYIDGVIRDSPRRPGFSSTMTRRSASSAVISSPASITRARTSSYFQIATSAWVTGSLVTRPASDSHRGAMLPLDRRS